MKYTELCRAYKEAAVAADRVLKQYGVNHPHTQAMQRNAQQLLASLNQIECSGVYYKRDVKSPESIINLN